MKTKVVMPPLGVLQISIVDADGEEISIWVTNFGIDAKRVHSHFAGTTRVGKTDAQILSC